MTNETNVNESKSASSETEASADALDLTPRTRRHFPWSNLGWILTLFAFLVVLAMFLYVNNHLATMNSTTTQTMNKLQNNFASLQKQVTDQQTNLQQITASMRTQDEALNQIKTAQNEKVDWKIAEAAYLAKLANYQLQFDKNIPLAVQLLQASNHTLENVDAVKYGAIRQALAADIAQLQTLPQLNVTELYTRVSMLKVQAGKLPLAQTNVNQTVAKANPQLSWWRAALENIWHGLQKIIVVRHNQDGVAPFTTPEQRAFLILNVQSNLEKTQLALLQHNQAVYRESLIESQNLIKKYFDQRAALTQSYLNDLNQLLNVNINPTLPNLQNSLSTFQQLEQKSG